MGSMVTWYKTHVFTLLMSLIGVSVSYNILYITWKGFIILQTVHQANYSHSHLVIKEKNDLEQYHLPFCINGLPTHTKFVNCFLYIMNYTLFFCSFYVLPRQKDMNKSSVFL